MTSKTHSIFLGTLTAALIIAVGCSRSEKKEKTGPDDGGRPPAVDGFSLTVEPTVQSIQRNLMDQYCVSCHSGATPPAKLDLTNLAVFADGEHGHGGYHGRLVVPAKPAESMLVIVMKSMNPHDQMPPAGSGIPRVKDEQLDAVRGWIGSLPATPDTDEPGTDEPGTDEPGTDEPGTDEPGINEAGTVDTCEPGSPSVSGTGNISEPKC